MAKALGYSVPVSRTPGPNRWTAGARRSPRPSTTSRRRWWRWPSELLKFPRHLGIHSGGMVLTERPVGEVVPIEHARKENRTVLQWDKDDCAWMGLVKFDLLGLGMLAALQYCMDMVREQLGEDVEAGHDPARRKPASTTSSARRIRSGCSRWSRRAQMATLPRLRPRRFYDLVDRDRADPARPDPGRRGASVHPPPDRGGADHLPASRSWSRCWSGPSGVPLFQEQLMQMAMAVGEIDGDEADLLRRAMGSKRGVEKISSLKAKLYAGMAAQRDHRGHWPTRSTPRSRRSRTSGSPSRTRSASPCSSTPAPGCGCTTRPRSSPRCCGRSRWGSTHRSPWSPTPAGTASRYAVPTCTCSGRRRRAGAAGRRAGADRADRVDELPGGPAAGGGRVRPEGAVRLRRCIAATARSPSGSGWPR